MVVTWERRHEALKAIHDKIAEVLAKLDNESDPQLVDILASTVTALKTITEVELISKGVIYRENIGSIVNGSFERDLLGWFVIDTLDFLKIDTTIKDVGGKQSLRADQDALGNTAVIDQFPEPAIETNEIVSFSCKVRVDCDDFDLGTVGWKCRILYTDGTVSTTTMLPSANKTWTAYNISWNTGKTIKIIRFQTVNDGWLENQVWIDSIAISFKPQRQVSPIQPTAILAGEQTVATAGTPVALGSGAVEHSVVVQAKSDNTGTITVGNSSGQHFKLSAGDITPPLHVDNLNKIYVDASVNGEGVNYLGS